RCFTGPIDCFVKFADVMCTRMQFEKGQQFTLVLFQLDLGCGSAEKLRFETLRRGSQWIALFLAFFYRYPAALDEGKNHLARALHLYSQILSRSRPLLEQLENH